MFDKINIHAVSTSAHGAANTDGWNVYRSDSVVIRNSVIVNGDDCVAFKPSMFSLKQLKFCLAIYLHADATNVLVENLDCTGSQYVT